MNLPAITVALSGLVAVCVFVALLWWFMFYAGAGSTAPFWFAAISVLLVIPIRASSRDTGFLADLTAGLLTISAVVFTVLGAIMGGIDDGGLARVGTALAFFVGAIAFSIAVGALLAGPLRPRM